MPHRLPVYLVAQAELELIQGRSFYEICRPRLGDEFVDAILACLNRIAESPRLYARVKKEYRRATIRRFPYAIYYEHINDSIVVYAVFHCSQDPTKIDVRLS